jgi:hypothetical protein
MNPGFQNREYDHAASGSTGRGKLVIGGNMTKIGALVLAVICFTIVMCAQDMSKSQDSGKAKQMSGTICAANCVTQQSNLATCDRTCTDKTGGAVFITDNGEVKQIANQEICKGHMGKHVKMAAVPTESQREDTLRILELNEQAP